MTQGSSRNGESRPSIFLTAPEDNARHGGRVLQKDEDAEQAINRWRYVSLVCSFLVALSAGSNYGFSAYSPQLQHRLHLSSTQINIVGVMGNMGVYLSGPIWGRLVDKRGPRSALVSGAILVLLGYGGLSMTYEGQLWETRSLALLAMLSLSTGLGNCAAFTAAMNAQAKSWHEERRGLATALVLSGFGLSAFFYSTLSHTLFPGKTGDYLLLLAFGSSFTYAVAFFLVKIYPHPAASLSAHAHESQSEEAGQNRQRRISTSFRRRASSDIGARAVGHVSMSDLEDEEEEDNLAAERQGGRAQEQQGLMQRSNGARSGDAKPVVEAVDLTGLKLMKNTDFQIIFAIMTLISGTGLLVINNIGTMTGTLYDYNKRKHPSSLDFLSTIAYDSLAARTGNVQELQAHQVSAISVGNASGRIAIGLLSDLVVNDTGNSKDRVYLLLVVCSLAIGSQFTAAWPNVISDLKGLFAMSTVTGLMYGTLFGLCPVLMLEWFGLKHFSQNWGIVSLSPVIAGNTFNLLFGRIYDSHVPTDRDVHICPDGEECFRAVFQITAAGAMVATALSIWIIRRRAQRAPSLPNDSALVT